MAAVFVLVALGACGFIHDEHLVGPYRLVAVDTSEQMAVCEGTGSAVHCVIPATVFAVGWDASFIIAKQHPFELPQVTQSDKSITSFWIIRISDRAVIGPLAKGEFETRRTVLGVPAELQFKKEFPELARAAGGPNSALVRDAYVSALHASFSAPQRGR
jgi:hypothetical protein